MNLQKLGEKQWKWVEDNGWHNKTPLEYLALIASEVGEAVNECRGQVTTQDLGYELADIILRTVDFAREMEIDLEGYIKDKMELNMQNGTKGRLK